MKPILIVLSLWALLFAIDFLRRCFQPVRRQEPKPDHKDAGDSATPGSPKGGGL